MTVVQKQNLKYRHHHTGLRDASDRGSGRCVDARAR